MGKDGYVVMIVITGEFTSPVIVSSLRQFKLQLHNALTFKKIIREVRVVWRAV